MSSTRHQKINAHHYRHIWAVGDIHDDHQLLQPRLHQLPFRPETDLLISVGGNIDHGPGGLNVLRPLNQPWFISAEDSHETMALEAFETDDRNMWLANSGDWFFDLDDSEQQEVIDLLLKFHHLPHIAEITNDTIEYVIVHAGYPEKEYQFGKEVAESELLWPVDRVQKPPDSELQKVNGVDFLISDHMMFDSIQTLTDQIYIDTGSPKSGWLLLYKIKQFRAPSAEHE